MIAEISGELLLGIAAIITAAGGIYTAIMGVKQARQEAQENADNKCRERLKEVQEEAETAGYELHRLKMKYPDEVAER